jgi:hypothetical protein
MTNFVKGGAREVSKFVTQICFDGGTPLLQRYCLENLQQCGGGDSRVIFGDGVRWIASISAPCCKAKLRMIAASRAFVSD